MGIWEPFDSLTTDQKQKKTSYDGTTVIGMVMFMASPLLHYFCLHYFFGLYYFGEITAGGDPIPIQLIMGQKFFFRGFSCIWIWNLSLKQKRNPLSNTILAAFFPAIMMMVQGTKGDSDLEEAPEPFKNEGTGLLKMVAAISLVLVVMNLPLSYFFSPHTSLIPIEGFPKSINIGLSWMNYFLFMYPLLSLVLALPFAAIPFKDRPYPNKLLRIAVFILLGLNAFHLIMNLLTAIDVLPLD